MSAMGRKQPVAAPLVALRKLSDQGRSGSQLFRYPYGSVAAIQRKFVAPINKIWWAQPGAAVPFRRIYFRKSQVVFISENGTHIIIEDTHG